MILNLTQHKATGDQLAAGVVEPQDKAAVAALLTFAGIPSKEEINAKARALADIAYLGGFKSAMIGGAPYLMAALEAQLKLMLVKPLYSFTERRSVEAVNADGSVTKTAIFAHVGWVAA